MPIPVDITQWFLEDSLMGHDTTIILVCFPFRSLEPPPALLPVEALKPHNPPRHLHCSDEKESPRKCIH